MEDDNYTIMDALSGVATDISDFDLNDVEDICDDAYRALDDAVSIFREIIILHREGSLQLPPDIVEGIEEYVIDIGFEEGQGL